MFATEPTQQDGRRNASQALPEPHWAPVHGAEYNHIPPHRLRENFHRCSGLLSVWLPLESIVPSKQSRNKGCHIIYMYVLQIIKRQQHDVQAAYSRGGKRTFYLVNSVVLVEQQVKVLRNLTSLSVHGYSSQDKVDLWCLGDWQKELERVQVCGRQLS